jgi:hypothetical protein
MLWTRISTMLGELCAVLQNNGCRVIEVSVTVAPADDEEPTPPLPRASEWTC